MGVDEKATALEAFIDIDKVIGLENRIGPRFAAASAPVLRLTVADVIQLPMLKKLNRRRYEEAIPSSLLLLLCWVAASSLGCVRQTQPSYSNPTCPAGLVQINTSLDGPVRLKILSTECTTPYFVKVDFQVESATDRMIQRYEIHLVTRRDGQIESDTLTSLTMTQLGEQIFTKDQTHSDSLGVSLKKSWVDNPKPVLTLSVTSATFADGTIWKPGT